MVGTDVNVGDFGHKAEGHIAPVTLPQVLAEMPNALVVGVEHNSDGSGLDVILSQSSTYLERGQVWREGMDVLERRAPESAQIGRLLETAQSMDVQPFKAVIMSLDGDRVTHGLG